MKTRSVMVQTLCVPCSNHCRYCLLSWDGMLRGADYARSERYAAAFHTWMKRNRPDLSFSFSFGYSMEHPALFQAIDFMRSIGSPGGEFLQMDGMRMRNDEQLRQLMEGLRDHGVKALNFTFYGTEAYHDCFSGRKGDFHLLMRSVEKALSAGLQVSAGIPVTQENALQADTLLTMLHEAEIQECRFFIPHEEGRGTALHDVRCKAEDLSLWSEAALSRLNRNVYRTEAEWIRDHPALPENRMLILSLRKDNIEHFEKTDFASAIRELEALDEEYYAALPSFSELAERFGNPQSSELFSLRDLQMRYHRKYITEQKLSLYDLTDESICSSRRY